MKKATGAFCAAALCASASWAAEFNGTLRGTVDGRAVDVAVHCANNGGWLQASTDLDQRGDAADDPEGRGVVATISGSQAAGQAVFTIKFGDELYRFDGTREVVFSETGLTMKSTLHRYEGRGMDRRIVSSYDVDLVLDCRG
jgi:hypothetical protein